MDAIEASTAPARWLIGAAVEGVPLTQTDALARVVVREAAERWPGWWDAELFGPPHREAELAVLAALHEGLTRLKLVRRRGRKLFATARGKQLVDDPSTLAQILAADLGGGDAYGEIVAATVAGHLATGVPCEHDALVAPALKNAHRGGWRDSDGRPPDERTVSWTVSEVLCRGEAYGLIQRGADPSQPRYRAHGITLTAGARALMGLDQAPSRGMPALVFDAELTNVRGVGARLAVSEGQHLTALHDAIQEAFGWEDDHLYSFWLDGKFWGDDESEFTSPITPDEAPQTADVPLAELDLSDGQKIAYVFDFGDEWRVRLTLRERADADGGAYPRVLERTGSAPPQYGHE